MGDLGTNLKISVSLQPFQNKKVLKKLDFATKIALEMIPRDLCHMDSTRTVTCRTSCHTRAMADTSPFVTSWWLAVLSGI